MSCKLVVFRTRSLYQSVIHSFPSTHFGLSMVRFKAQFDVNRRGTATFPLPDKIQRSSPYHFRLLLWKTLKEAGQREDPMEGRLYVSSQDGNNSAIITFLVC